MLEWLMFAETYDTKSVILALAFTLIAGISTGIGSLIALFAKKTNTRILAVALGFSAGVMIYVSFIEIFFQAKDALTANLGVKAGSWVTVASFFGGMLFIALIDRILPDKGNPHEVLTMPGTDEAKASSEIKNGRLMRVGVLTALAIAIHNFPEGIATFLSALTYPALAVGVTVAIALHNIPEGISVYIPIYYATGNRKKAFMYSFLSGLSEPIGALVGYLILRPFLSETLYGILFAGVAGIMVFISLDELLPSAREYGETHLSIYGLVSGMVIMAISLLLFL
jgi:ZIP family zinc transporter